MLQIVIPAVEKLNNKTNEIIYTNSQSLQLEHSLLSISKWEMKWKKPFPLIQARKDYQNITVEELIDYIKCMTITQNVKADSYDNLTGKNLEKIIGYINNEMTATWFSTDKGKRKSHGRPPIITNEVIYYLMTAYSIPFDPCEKWHFNRLMTLIRVCEEKNESGNPSKISKADLVAQNRALNAQRKAAAAARRH